MINWERRYQPGIETLVVTAHRGSPRILPGLLSVALGLGSVVAQPSAALAQDSDQLMPADLVAAGVAEGTAARLTVDSDPSRMSTAFTTDGVLAGEEDGSPIAGEVVQVSLEQNSPRQSATLKAGGVSPMLPLAVARTEERGGFRLSVPALRDISSYVSDTGEAQLVFTSFGPDHSLLFRVQAQLPDMPETPAEASIPDERIFGARAVAASSAASGKDTSIALTDITLTATGGSADSASTLDYDPAIECARVVDPDVDPIIFGWVQPTDGRPFIVLDHVLLQMMQTASNSNAAFNWDSSTETTVTAGVDFAYNGELLKGGFRSSMQEKVSLGKTFPVGVEEAKWAEVEWIFMWRELVCQSHVDLILPDVFELVPVEPTGGDRFLPGLGIQCGGPDKTVEINVETRFGHGTTATWSFNSSFFGLALDAQQTHTDDHELKFTPVDGTAHICGEDDVPASTALVKEV